MRVHDMFAYFFFMNAYSGQMLNEYVSVIDQIFNTFSIPFLKTITNKINKIFYEMNVNWDVCSATYNINTFYFCF